SSCDSVDCGRRVVVAYNEYRRYAAANRPADGVYWPSPRNDNVTELVPMRILTIPALVLRFARIRRRRRAAVARAVVLLLVARASVLARPFATVARGVDRTRASRRPQRRAALKDARWATKVVGDRLFPSNPCLPQALVAQYGLLRRGLPAE